jgi:hypothetical protein
MASPSWPSPYPDTPPPPAYAAAYDLRPLSLGEILDRTFTVYRRHFWLFAGISCISGAVQLLGSALNMIFFHGARTAHSLRVADFSTAIATVVLALLFLLASAVTQAATIYAISEVYLARRASIGDSIRAVLGKWYRYVGIMLWTVWSGMWLFVVIAVPAAILAGVFAAVAGLKLLAGLLFVLAFLAGGVYGVIAYIRNSLAVAASVVEGLTIRPSMRRSKVLAAGAKGRIFVVYLIFLALSWIIGIAQAPLIFVIARNPTAEHMGSQAIMLLLGFAAHVLLTPVLMIGLSLVYFDQRVRKEAFDLAFLLGGVAPAPAASFQGEPSPFGLAPEASAFSMAPTPPAPTLQPSPFGIAPTETSPFGLTPPPPAFLAPVEPTEPTAPPEPSAPAETAEPALESDPPARLPPLDDEPLP